MPYIPRFDPSPPGPQPDSAGYGPIDNVGAFFLNASYTQRFGPTHFPGEPNNFHQGIDVVPQPLTNPSGNGQPIFAPASGRVIFAGCDPRGCDYGFGNHVVIDAPNGFRYTLGHLKDRYGEPHMEGGRAGSLLQIGDTVHVGDIVGHMGSTGYARGAHLHLQINDPNGNPVDPGREGHAVDYTLYHDLDWGAGDQPGQDPNGYVPDPLAHNQKPPTILPFRRNPSDAYDTRYPQPFGSPGGNPPGNPSRNTLPPGSNCDICDPSCGLYNPSDPSCQNGNNPPQPPQPPNTNNCPQGSYTVPDPNTGQCPPGYTSTTTGCICVFNSGNNGGGSGGIFPDFGQMINEAAPAILFVVGGLVLGIIGLFALFHEEPIQAIVQPVAQASKGTVRASKKLAMLAK